MFLLSHGSVREQLVSLLLAPSLRSVDALRLTHYY